MEHSVHAHPLSLVDDASNGPYFSLLELLPNLLSAVLLLRVVSTPLVLQPRPHIHSVEDQDGYCGSSLTLLTRSRGFFLAREGSLELVLDSKQARVFVHAKRVDEFKREALNVRLLIPPYSRSFLPAGSGSRYLNCCGGGTRNDKGLGVETGNEGRSVFSVGLVAACT